MELHGPEMEAHVADLRNHFWGERKEHNLMPVGMKESYSHIEVDIRDMKRQSTAAAPQEGRNVAPAKSSAPQEGVDIGTGERHPRVEPSAVADATGKGEGRSEWMGRSDEGAAEVDPRLEIDRRGMTGGEFYVLWSGTNVHPWYAAVVLACASHAWLMPEFLQSLVSDLEGAMLETEDLLIP